MLFKAAILVAVCACASGQIGTRISGRVVDPSGAPIRTSAVRLKAASDRTTVLVDTGEDGTFAFPAESERTYELKIESLGFATIVKTIHVGTDKEYKTGDIVMSVGNASFVEVDGTVVVQGIGGSRATLSIADLAKLPQHTVKISDHGTPVTFQGVLLADVLSKVAGPTGEVRMVTGPAGVEYYSTAALYSVVVRGHDGNHETFAWAELDPRFTNRAVYLVTKRDGKPLSDSDGPFQLVVAGDKSAVRWIRQLSVLTIVRAH
jgi:hypothetical protein